MFQALKIDQAISFGAAALLGLIWVCAPRLAIGLPIRVVLVGLLISGVAGMIIWATRRRQEREAAAKAALERLCVGNDAGGFPGTSNEFDSGLPLDNPWHSLIRRLTQAAQDERERLQQAEQARMRAELKLRRLTAERGQLNEVLSSLSDPVLAIDNFDELVLANPSAQRLFSMDPQLTEKRALESLVRCQELVDLLTDTRRRKTPTQRSTELSVSDAEGETHWYRVTCRGLTQNGEPTSGTGGHGAMAVLSDISAHKVIQKRNAEFVSAVSHEMKAPLSGIKAYVELLADGDAEDEATREEFLGVINSQADRLQRLIDNLLNLARIEAGVAHVQKETQSLNGLLDEALNVVAPLAEAKRITLKGDLSPLYLSMHADRDMVLQAAINLLSNAIKYTPDGGAVTLRSRLADGELSFEVEDTGVGLSPEDVQRVFEKFYRVKKDRQMAPGTGLGLPLAKHIVEEIHGGRLTVESELGRGSTFRATIPAAVDMKS